MGTPATAPPRTRRPGRPREPGTPRAVERAASATFGALSRLRRARIFHPVGVGYSGTLRVEPGLPYRGVPLLQQGGEHAVVLRFSRALGLPEGVPDALGIAIRILDVHGPGRHQDFLLVTSAGGPLLHHLLLPGVRGFFGQSFSSLLLYRVGDAVRVVGAQPATEPAGEPGSLRQLVATADRGDLCFRLALAPVMGGWRRVGEIGVGVRLADEEVEQLAFTPWNTGGGIRPVGPLMGLRRAAYRGSQRGRGLPPSRIP